MKGLPTFTEVAAKTQSSESIPQHLIHTSVVFWQRWGWNPGLSLCLEKHSALKLQFSDFQHFCTCPCPLSEAEAHFESYVQQGRTHGLCQTKPDRKALRHSSPVGRLYTTIYSLSHVPHSSTFLRLDLQAPPFHLGQLGRFPP